MISDVGNIATLTVRQSDDPISIDPANLYVSGNEGETVSFTVIRGGRANG